jgi:hypothetical protein
MSIHLFGMCVLLTRCCAEELCDMAFLCTLMDDPVVASDGFTYNREEIQNWLKDHDTSPHTNEPFDHKILIPNIDMRKRIIAWREKHGLPIPSFGAAAKVQAPAASTGVAAAAQILKPAAVCGYSKQPLQVFCITCDKAICVSCAIDPARCKPHDTRQLASIVSSVRDVHAAWLQLREGRPQQLQAESQRIDAAADAAIQAIREEAAELKVELQRVCVGDLEGALEEQAQLLADVEVAAASPANNGTGETVIAGMTDDEGYVTFVITNTNTAAQAEAKPAALNAMQPAGGTDLHSQITLTAGLAQTKESIDLIEFHIVKP